MYFDQLTNLGIKLRRRSGIEKTTCPQCSEGRRNKKDPCLSVNITEGIWNCHNCAWKGTVKQFDRQPEKKNFKKPEQSMLKHIDLSEKIVSYCRSRGLSQATLEKFMIHGKEEWMPQTQKPERCIVFPYIRNGELINAKYRDGNKGFKLVKDAELIFFGMQTLQGRHCAIICEGEFDALSAYEAGFGQDYPLEPNEDGEVVEHELGRWAVLSVPNGASKGSQKLEYLDNCSDFLTDIDEFIIATDADEAGVALRDELIRRLGAEKCRIVEYPLDAVVSLSDGSKRACKDLNEVLVHFGASAVISALNGSQPIPVDGIYYLEDVFPSMLDNFRKGIQLAPTTRFGDMDDYFRWKKGDINLWTGYANAGKALALDTKIPTPNGFTTMGEIKCGDVVFDENGKQCRVVFAHDIMYNRPCYEIVFSDGSKVVADESHLWVTHTEKSRILNNRVLKQTEKSKAKIRTTKEILDTIHVVRKDGTIRNNHSIDMCLPIQCPPKDFHISPYCLGAWLGDGTSVHASITCNDAEILKEFEICGFVVKKRKNKYLYGICNGFLKKLRDLNLIGNKHIPLNYLRGSIEQRLELLKGLMDTDGYIDSKGRCEFTTINYELSKQVYELICSLGVKASLKEGNATLNGGFVSKKYRIHFKPLFCPFKIKRKKERFTGNKKNNHRTISSITKVESVPVRCITVDSPNSMYLCTESFIPTHNTFFVLQLMLTKSIYDGWKWAIFSPENFPANDFYDDLVQMYLGKFLDKATEDEYVTACHFINQHIFYVYPEDEHDINSIHEKFRYLILKKGVDGVLIDPFNQLDKIQKPYERDDQYLSVILKEIKRFALLNGVCYNIVAHPKNPTYKDNKELPVADMYDLHGGSMWGNKSDGIISYHRPNFHIDKNDPTVDVYIQKLKRKRTGGKLGSFRLRLVWSTQRYCDEYDNVFCDPVKAERIKSGEVNGILPSTQQPTFFDNEPF